MVDASAAGHVETLRLPRSGWLLQWRSDDFWRELNDVQHRAKVDGSHLPAEDEWVRWSGTHQPQEASVLAKQLICVTLVAAVGLLSGCHSDTELSGTGGFTAGETWAEQRTKAKTILARFSEDAGRPSQSPGPSATNSSSDSSAIIPGMSFDSVVVDPKTTRMKVNFIGTVEPASSPCGADYSAEAVESDKAVVIIVLEQRNPYSGICTKEGVGRSAALNLARPLGDRVVFNLQKDQPIPVSTAPVSD